MNNFIHKKPRLQNYELAMQLRGFFSDFLGDLSSYQYISATERRCFNLAYYFLQGKDRQRLLSNNGMLHYHKELASVFAATGDFPKIMIIDDLMVHGRGMSKFLYQLEVLIEDDLKEITVQNQTLIPAYEILNFRHHLVQAVDIYIYARNEKPLLIEDRYRRNIKSFYTLSEKQMHDLSWQLSDSLTRWEIANTCFVYSEHNEQLAKRLICESQIRKINSGSWKQLNWIYDVETMGLFIRFFNKEIVQHISSVRFFPGRCVDLSRMWFTSFSMIGAISRELLNDICDRIKETLQCSKQNDFAFLIDVLQDRTPGMQRSRGQLLYFLVSLIDYKELCEVLQINDPIKSEEDVIRLTDVGKISRNFGLYEEVFPEISRIVCSKQILKQIKGYVYQLMDSDLAPIHPLRQMSFTQSEETEFDLYNNAVEEIFYQIGIDAEENAKEWFENTHLFHSDSYQEYTDFGIARKTDGVIALSDFHLIADQDKGTCKNLIDLYSRTAALIGIMDYGVMGTRIHYSPQLDCQFPLCKAGEMATFFGPRKLAIAIPAFVLLEKYSRRMALTAKEAIIQFCNSIDISAITGMMIGDELTVWKREYISIVEKLPEQAEKYTSMLYRGGQTYQEWNFQNLTYKNHDVWLKCQWALEKQALKFLRLDDSAT